MVPYEPKKIEPKWQEKWLQEKTFAAHDGSKKQKYYQLETFPYPSGAGLHVGHPKGYIGEDIIARFTRMHGKEVLYPMGWDAFGLPTENYALKTSKTPREATRENTDNFRRQVRMLGLSYDWGRELSTAHPGYYKWTQWLFIQLFKNKLAYRAKAKVNWCPKDQTVLANEQVINGKCERCGSTIEERDMEQWFFKITDYADRLLDGLKGLDWPAPTIKRQEDWIGKSEGALIKFSLKGISGQKDGDHFVEVFTTRPDTIFGATFIVIAPELAEKWINVGWKASDEVKAYVKRSLSMTERERMEKVEDKTGVSAGIFAVNPASKEEIPVWVADYVLGSYGTGAIMAVPAHDERDFAFAKKFNLPIKIVIEPETGPKLPNEERRSSIIAIVEDNKAKKFLTLNWGPKLGGVLFIGGGREEGEDEVTTALREIKEETGYTNVKFVGKTERMHHHYFAFSKNVARNIDVVGLHFILEDHAQAEKSLQEDEKDNFKLEWRTKEEVARVFEDESHIEAFRRLILGEIYSGPGILADSGEFTGMDSEKAKWEIVKAVKGERKTQYKLRDWSVSRQRYWGVPIPMIHCPKCGAVPVPEKDLPVVLPELEDFRPKGMPPLAASKEFMNVPCPQCGGEAQRDPETLDTFVDSSWYYLRYTDPRNEKEIFEKAKVEDWMPVKLYVIGAEHTVLHLLYSRFITKFLHDEGHLSFEEPFLKLRHQGLIRGADGQKMSKSKGNVVNPDELVEEFGADTLRLYEMFMGPFEDGAPWDPKAILGVERFLKRAWDYVNKNIDASNKTPDEARAAIHKTIKKVTEDIEGFKFNTAISSLMILLNTIESASIDRGGLEIIVKLLYPFAPHACEELWSLMGHANTIAFEPWPTYDEKLIAEEKIQLVLQVNGKVRDTIEADADIDEAQAKSLALANEKVKTSLGGAEPKRVVYVPKKIVNIVI